jgi:hypothetical protein
VNLTGIAAILALGSIPVNVLIARWQLRSSAAQAEAAYRSALGVAEAQHRSALEVAEANHRAALAEAQAEHDNTLALEWARAQREDAHETLAGVRAFRNAVTALRAVFLSDNVDDLDLREAQNVVHDTHHEVRMSGIIALSHIATEVDIEARRLRTYAGASKEHRDTQWEQRMSGLRSRMDEVVSERRRPNAPFIPGSRTGGPSQTRI